MRPFSVVFGRTYNTKDKISKEHTSTVKKVITVFIAVIILPLTLLFGAIGAIMVSYSSSHKRAYKQEQNHTKPIAPISITSPTPTRNVSSPKLVKEQTSQIELFIKERGLQEKIALNARYHLSPFDRPCEYPQRIGCGTPFVNRDRDKLHAQSRQVLFAELSINLKNSLNALEVSEKNLILDQVLDSQITEYDGIVHQMEKDLFSFFQSDLLDVFRFDTQELSFDTLDEKIKGNLQQCLTKPLNERLNQFAPTIQDALLLSAYCQLKKVKTGTGDVIKY